MTRSPRRGVLLAVLHLVLIGAVAGTYLLDRVTRPRVWARTSPLDPDLPIRGRYVRLRVDAEPDQRITAENAGRVTLSAVNGQLVASPADDGERATLTAANGIPTVAMSEPLAFFIPEHIVDPSRRPEGEQLWVEVTIPRRGAPRPIRLGVKRGGELTPLSLR